MRHVTLSFARFVFRQLSMGPSSGATPLHNLTVSRRQDSRSDGVPCSARPMPEWQISSSGNANTTFRNIALSPLQGFHPDLRQGGGSEARGVKIRQSVPSSQRSLRRSRHLQYHALTNSLASISAAFWFAAGFAHGGLCPHLVASGLTCNMRTILQRSVRAYG